MRKIFVVDDNADILIALEELLKYYGYEVITSDRGDDVMRMIQMHEPDLLLLDVMLSGYDGTEICRAIKSNEMYRHLPVVMISAHPNAAQMVAEAGANDFLPKPFDISSLVDRVKKNLAPALMTA